MLRGLLVSAATLLCLATAPALAAPTDFSFTGTFADDDDVQLFTFTVTQASTVTLRSFSYAGGTNAAGTAIQAGGFDPILSLFDGTGELIAQQDDAEAGDVPEDPASGEGFDVLLKIVLNPGTYTVAISQYSNFAVGPNLSNGFEYVNSPNFTARYGCSQGQFCDAVGKNRTSTWAFDILNVESASTPPVSVPEPATLASLGIGLAGIAGLRRRRSA